LQAEVNVYFDLELGPNGSWMIYFQRLYKTRLELEEFGWQEGGDTYIRGLALMILMNTMGN
jgi:hypothetical protein